MMFGFKAYFWNEEVYIQGHKYRSNEILTSCLNLSTDALHDYLESLKELRLKVQLKEGGGEYFCAHYDEYVQQAQSLFYKVGAFAKQIPLYHDLRLDAKLDSPVLFDYLNSFFYWEDGIDHTGYFDDEEPPDDDFCNEYGFMTRDNKGNSILYRQHFVPHVDDLNSDDPDIVLLLCQANEMIRKIFDQYIAFVQDLIRVQTAYSQLLDSYIHRDRKFLSDSETAERFIQYLHDTETRSALHRVRSSDQMKMSYDVYRRKDGTERLCEVYDFDNLGVFLYIDFFRGLSRGYLPRRCDNCGRYFLLTAGKYSNYCERPLKDDPSKICRDIGSRKRYDDKCKNDPVWLAYNRAYKAHYARYMKKKMTTAQFEQWSRYAVELREQVSAGQIEQAEYERILKI